MIAGPIIDQGEGRMTAWHPGSEQERTSATVTQREGQLRRAQEHARRAGETLRRALRGVEEAESVLGEAKRRLDRMESRSPSELGHNPVERAISLSWRCR
jgi:GAF domain-containing protein